MANWITLSRIPALGVIVAMILLGGPGVRLAAAPLVLVFMLFDTVDGLVARATGSESLLGSVLDIAADRIYELTLWVLFAHLGVIPVAIPMIVIARTGLTDALRSVGVGQGQSPFEQHRSRLGSFIVGSRWMRMGYGMSKGAAFCGMALGVAFASYPEGTWAHSAASPLLAVSVVVAWIAVVLCVVRGLPVILGAARRSWEAR